jgi:transcriptional regulator with XRE-family HTH domain
MNAEDSMLKKRIRALRRKFKMSQEDLAQLLGCDRVTVSHYEHGRAIPPLYVAQRMAQIFNVSLDELVEEAPNAIDAALGCFLLEAPRAS